MDTQATSKRGETFIKSAPARYLQYLQISTRIYTACRRALGSSTLQLPAGPGVGGRGRRGLAENNKYHFLPPLTGRFGTGGRGPRGPPGWGGTRGGSQDWRTRSFDSLGAREWRTPMASRLGKGRPALAPGAGGTCSWTALGAG